MSHINCSFPTFLTHCSTFNPGSNEPCPVPDWPYVTAIAEQMVAQDRLLVLKSRQMMVTWLACAYLLWKGLQGAPGVHLIISKEERSARELIARIQFLYDHLPSEMRVGKVTSSVSAFRFPDWKCRILSLPASPHAVRGLSPHTVLWDEIAFCRYDEDIWTAIKPAVDAGGQFIGISTPNGPTGVFASLAHDISGHFVVHRVHYKDNPTRNAHWLASARAGLSDAKWRREQELSFEGAEGRVYDQFNAQTHVLDEHNVGAEGSRFYRGLDFGYRHPAVVWVEEKPSGELVVFDSLVGDRWSLAKLMDEMTVRDRQHNLTEKDFSWMAVDPAGAAKTDFGISPVESLEQAGYKLVFRTSNITPGVETLRSLLLDASGVVRLKVHKRCRELITAFDGYRWAKEGDLPLKDGEHDHIMDALRYLIINLPRYHRQAAQVPPRVGGLPSASR